MFTDNGGYSYINSTGQHFSAPFSNTVIPTGPHTRTFAQRGGKNASVSKKVNKRKIKNISNMYKMPARKLKHYKKSLKRKLNGSKRRRTRSRRISVRRRSSRRYKQMKGGSTVSYSVGGVLSPEMVGMANGLVKVNVDNNLPAYNHYARV
jgi:hypothetical protein